MRRVDREHIEKRVTCKDCINKYCLECNHLGCPACQSQEFYTSHTKGTTYPDTDLDTIHSEGDAPERTDMPRQGRATTFSGFSQIEPIDPVISPDSVWGGSIPTQTYERAQQEIRDLNRAANNEHDARVYRNYIANQEVRAGDIMQTPPDTVLVPGGLRDGAAAILDSLPQDLPRAIANNEEDNVRADTLNRLWQEQYQNSIDQAIGLDRNATIRPNSDERRRERRSGLARRTLAGTANANTIRWQSDGRDFIGGGIVGSSGSSA